MNKILFSEEACRAVGNYVYRLIDPRNGETFYVGKGKNNRVFQHAQGLPVDVSDEESNGLSEKLGRIRTIQNAGLEVIHVIHRHAIPDTAIFEVEAALIDAYPGLTNIQGGHGSGARGPMNHIEIENLYALPEMEINPPHRLILININSLEVRKDRKVIYDKVRFAWRISVEKARKAEYILAVVRGVVIGAFKADQWLSATSDNFPEFSGISSEESNRYGFKGAPAEPEIWDRYAGVNGKRIVRDELRHIQNPIRYWNV